MEVVMLLCDYAEALNGKLYITGGGWTQYRGKDAIACSVAVSLSVPWTQTNQKHSLALELQTEDRETVSDPDGNAVRIEGEFEVGRPPGAVPGDPIVNTLAFRFQGLTIPSGGYRFSFSIDGSEEGVCRFRVSRPEGE